MRTIRPLRAAISTRIDWLVMTGIRRLSAVWIASATSPSGWSAAALDMSGRLSTSLADVWNTCLLRQPAAANNIDAATATPM